ncbi:hypothetical protein [Listeria valentina]|uniref:hypothetical protein n=1 Tax=Listeria valentina TaxID=2705293 RepID=UPI00142FF3FA|nr:hypothetical protein [Listeria valentina]
MNRPFKEGDVVTYFDIIGMIFEANEEIEVKYIDGDYGTIDIFKSDDAESLKNLKLIIPVEEIKERRKQHEG